MDPEFTPEPPETRKEKGNGTIPEESLKKEMGGAEPKAKMGLEEALAQVANLQNEKEAEVFERVLMAWETQAGKSASRKEKTT